MLTIIRTEQDDIEVEIAQDGLREEFERIEEMGRLKTWRIQSASLTKEKYLTLKNELEKPGFLQVTGRFLHPDEEKVLYLKCRSEIVSLNQERDDLQYSIEFRLKDAEGLYGGAQDVSPKYSTLVFTMKDDNDDPIEGVDIEIYNITHTTDEDGVARFNNFYKLEEFNFSTGEWEQNEEELTYDIYGIENELNSWQDTIYIDEEQEEININLSINNITLLDTEGNEVSNTDIKIGEEVKLTTDSNGQTYFYTHSNETLSYVIDTQETDNLWKFEGEFNLTDDYETSNTYERTLRYNSQKEEMDVAFTDFGLEYELMYYDVKMTVMDYETDTAVENATVTIETTDEIDIAQTKSETTDSNGEAVIKDILLENETGKYKIEHSDYEYDFTGYITVPDGLGASDKTIETTKYIHDEEPFVIDYKGRPTEPIEPQFDFGLEYEELTYSIDFTVYEYDSEATDDKGSLAEGAELTFVDHHGDTYNDTTDSNGEATLSGFRSDTSYRVEIDHNDEETVLLFNYSESYAKDNDWSLTREVILIKDDCDRTPIEPIEPEFEFNLAYEGGYFIDFSDSNELDNWTSRYVTDHETWSIVDDTDAVGDKLLKHETTQNLRRLFSYDPLWELWNDGQFGKKAWRDMEIVGKVMTTDDTGNQLRLYARAGYNMENFYPVDDIDLDLSLYLKYKEQIDINFTVKDSATDDLLEEATITLTLDYDYTKEKTTDSNGEASFSDEDSGTYDYEYEVTRSGYEDKTGTIEVSIDDTTINEEVLLDEI